MLRFLFCFCVVFLFIKVNAVEVDPEFQKQAETEKRRAQIKAKLEKEAKKNEEERRRGDRSDVAQKSSGSAQERALQRQKKAKKNRFEEQSEKSLLDIIAKPLDVKERVGVMEAKARISEKAGLFGSFKEIIGNYKSEKQKKEEANKKKEVVRKKFKKQFKKQTESKYTRAATNPTFEDVIFKPQFYYYRRDLIDDVAIDEKEHLMTGSTRALEKSALLLMEVAKRKSKITLMRNLIKPWNLNFVDQFGNSALLYAVRYNNQQGARILINRGADPNVCNKVGICPLHIAAYYDIIPVFDMLLKYGADPLKTDNDGIDALLYAIEGGALNAVKMIVEYGFYDGKGRKFQNAIIDFARLSENARVYIYLLDRWG